MHDENQMMPGDIPDWVQKAEEIQNGDFSKGEAAPELTIKFGRGLVGKPFTSRSGKELVEVKIPNTDKEDHSPWASFVIAPGMIHDNQYGKGVWIRLPMNGTTRINTPCIEGKKEDGRNIWKNEYKEIPNTELKNMLEAYKKRDHTESIEEP